MYNRFNVNCTTTKRSAVSHILHISYKAQDPNRGNFDFTKMTTEGAGQTQISTRRFQSKKGKIWWTVPNERQNYINKYETKLTWNAASMSAKQLQILKSRIWKSFDQWHPQIALQIRRGQGGWLMYNTEPSSLPTESCDAQSSWITFI